MVDESELEWTLEGEDDLIDLFQANRCMWDTNDKRYTDRSKKVYVKKAMARRLKVSVEEMEKKWKSVRTMYRKAVKVGKSGSAAKDLTEKQKQLVRRLYFLAPFTKGAEGIISSLDAAESSVEGSQEDAVANAATAPTPAPGANPNNAQNEPPQQPEGNELVPVNGQVDGNDTASTGNDGDNGQQPTSAARDEPQPGPSGVTTRSTRSGRTQTGKGKKTNAKKKVPAAAAGSSDQTARDEAVDLTESPQVVVPSSPRSPTPPPPKKRMDLTVPSPPRSLVRAVRGKKKDPKVTLAELRNMLAEEEAALAGSVTEDQPFSSLNESPLSAAPATSGPRKKASVVDEERVLTLREVRSTMQAHRQRTQQNGDQARKRSDPDDEVGMWAWQCERKVRKLEDKILQEDVMDHVSAIIKRASRGQWSAVGNGEQRYAAPKQSEYTPPLHSYAPHLPRSRLPTTTATSASHSIQRPMATASSFQATTQQQVQPPDQIAAFANWLQSGNLPSSPSLPQGPLAVPVTGAMMPFTNKSGSYTNLPGN